MLEDFPSVPHNFHCMVIQRSVLTFILLIWSGMQLKSRKIKIQDSNNLPM